MKITSSISFLILFLLFTFGGCKPKDSKKTSKIPGAFKAMQLQSFARAFPNSDIPKGAFGAAIDYYESNFQSVDHSPVDPWETMGPINTAGRTLALAVNPQADSTVYLGSASGGLWRTRKLGLDISWEYMPIANGVLGVSSIAFAAGDSTQLYVGTGEVYNNEITGNDGAYRATRGSYGVGIFKSSNGGATWEHALDYSYQNKKGIQVIKVDPNNDQIVYAGVTDGLIKSTDAGNTWNYVLDVPMVTDLEIQDQNLVVACGNLGSENGGIYNSQDGGTSWSINMDDAIPSAFGGKILLASYPQDPNIIYASVGNGFSFSDGATWLLRSDDGGQTWETRSTFDYSKWQGWFSHDVSVDPNNPDIISLVGIEIYKSTDAGSLITLKANGGVTMGIPQPNVPDGPPDYSHSDHHVAMYHPTIEGLILYGNDGGLFLSSDGGETFRSANGGLQTTQYYNGFSVSHQNPDFAMGGLQDNSTSIHRGNGLWQRAIGGDGSWTGINFNNDDIVYGSYQNLNIAASNNNGFSFFILDVPHEGNPIFIAPYQISESDPNIIYGGGQYLYKSTDAGNNWEASSSTIHPDGDPIYAMAISSTDPNQLYVSTAPYNGKGEIYRSLDGGDSWSNVSQGLPNRFINDIYIDPSDDQTIYVVLSGFGSGHVFKSENRGASWNDISANLPDLPTNAVLVDPSNPDHVYIGNDIGTFYTLDGGANWEDFNEGIQGSTIIMDLEYSPIDNKIWAATHGRGVFRREMIPQQTSLNDIDKDVSVDLSIFPNPILKGNPITAQIGSTKRQRVQLLMQNQLGEEILKTELNISEGVNSFKFETVNYSKGIYFFTLQDTKGTKYSKSVIIN